MKIGCFFPGYGNQFVSMAKDIYDESRLVQEYFEEASHCLDTNFIKLCFASSESELSKLQNAYPANFLVSSAILGLLKSKNVHCSVVSGYGIGEYAALNAAGSLNFVDGLYLLSKLALFSGQEMGDVGYTSLRISGMSEKAFNQKYAQFIEQSASLELSAHLSSHAFLISGLSDEIEELKRLISIDRKKTPGIKAVITHELGGLYTPRAESLIKRLSMYLEKVDFKDCTVDFVRGSDGKLVSEGKKIRKSILKQLAEPINIMKAMKKFDDVDMIIVPTPGVKWAQQLKDMYPKKHIVGVHTLSDIDKLVTIYNEAEALGVYATPEVEIAYSAEASQ